MNDNLVVENRCQKRLDDLELYFDRSHFSLKAVAYCIDRAFNQRRLLGAFRGVILGRRGRGGRREVGVGYELANAVESSGCQGNGAGFGG